MLKRKSSPVEFGGGVELSGSEGDSGLPPVPHFLKPLPASCGRACKKTTLVVRHKLANNYLAPMSDPELISPDDETPPILGSWKNIYTVVLVLHVVLIILFYLFSNAYA